MNGAYQEDASRFMSNPPSQVSSSSSIDSIPDHSEHRLQRAESVRSDDLERLSLCLSEVSAASGVIDSEKSTLFNDVVQAQLAFWTLVISIFYTYAWQQHRKKFIAFLLQLMVVPPVVLICCTLSSLLTVIVVLGRIFSTPLKFDDVLKMADGSDDDGMQMSASRSAMNIAGTNGLPTANDTRRRTLSGNNRTLAVGIALSSQNSIRRYERSGGSSSRIGARSSSCEDLVLPRPVCRKHSSHQHGHNNGINSAEGSRYFHKHNGSVRPTSNHTSDTTPIAGSITNISTNS